MVHAQKKLWGNRVDEIFFCDLPDREERAQILNIHIRRFKRDPNQYDVKAVAGITDGFSGAELEQIIIDSLFAGFALDREPILDDLIASATRTVPLSKTMSEQIKSLRSWAETRARKAGKLDQRIITKRKNSRRVDLAN